MYGSPFRSGYGDLDKMFSSAHVLPNLERYLQWSVGSHTILIVLALAAPFALKRYGSSRTAWWLLGFAAATLACYLPYVVFDAWWYTRFLLPALLPWLALTAAVLVAAHRETTRRPRGSRLSSCAAVAAVSLFLHTGSTRDVFRIRDLEWRFRSVGEFVATMPADAAFITLHHSGSIRFYASRSTVGWADIDKGRLDDAIAFLRRHGRRPYLLFERWEEPQFRERFAGERLGALDWPATAEVDGVRIMTRTTTIGSGGVNGEDDGGSDVEVRTDFPFSLLFSLLYRRPAERPNLVEHRREVGRLRQASKAEPSRDHVRFEEGGDADDRNPGESWIAELLFAKLPSVHSRHLQIEEHQTWDPLPHLLEGLEAVGSAHRFVARGREQQLHELANIVIIFHNQHAGHVPWLPCPATMGIRRKVPGGFPA